MHDYFSRSLHSCVKSRSLKNVLSARVLKRFESIQEETSVEIGQPMDVFAFGVMVWQMVSKVGADQWKYGWRLKPSDILPSFPPYLKLMVEACWDPTPANRPSFAEHKHHWVVGLLLAGETGGVGNGLEER